MTLACGVGLVVDGGQPAPWRSAIALGALGLAIVMNARMLWRARHRAAAAGLDQSAVPTADEDALSDLAAIGSPFIDPIRRRLPRIVARVDLRRHPWRVALLVALGAGLALGVAHGMSEGGPPALDRLPMAVLAGLILTTIEAVAVLLGFLVLGRYLEIRPASEGAPSPTP